MHDAPRGGNGWRWAALLFGAAFLISGALLLWDVVQSRRELDANQQLARRVREARDAALTVPVLPAPEREDTEPPEPPPKYAPSGNLSVYDGLWQENHDLAGWLAIEGLGLELPVMHTPEDTEYYLHRAFDETYAYSGSLFLGEGWTPEGGYAIIYGHNMKNETMFGHLHWYQEQAFAQEYPTIRFDTLTEEREYTVLAAFYSQSYTAGDIDVFRYYQYTDLSDPEVFSEYVNQVRAAALYDTGVEVQYGDRLLALSTCSYHRKNGRFVVVAVQRAEPEEETKQ